MCLTEALELGEAAFKPDGEWSRISIGRHREARMAFLVRKRGRAKVRRRRWWNTFGECYIVLFEK